MKTLAARQLAEPPSVRACVEPCECLAPDPITVLDWIGTRGRHAALRCCCALASAMPVPTDLGTRSTSKIMRPHYAISGRRARHGIAAS